MLMAGGMANATGGPRISSFQLAQDIVIDAPPEQLWEALTTQIDAR
jgi:hypothetical protein